MDVPWVVDDRRTVVTEASAPPPPEAKPRPPKLQLLYVVVGALVAGLGGYAAARAAKGGRG